MTSFMNVIALLLLSASILQVSNGEWTEEQKKELKGKMEECMKSEFGDDEQFEKLKSIYEEHFEEICKCNGKGKKEEDLSEEEKNQWDEEKRKTKEECKKCMLEHGADEQHFDKASELRTQCFDKLKNQPNPEEAQSELESVPEI